MKALVQKQRPFSGFTMLELMISLALLGVMGAIAVPAISSRLPEYRLKRAVRDLYSNMQFIKMRAIKAGESYKLAFDPVGSSYTIQRPDETPEKIIYFLDYDSNGNIGYGRGKATKGANSSGGSIPSDFISFQYNRASFNTRGTGSTGYVYLSNRMGTVYAVGTWSAGVVMIKKWNDSTKAWE